MCVTFPFIFRCVTQVGFFLYLKWVCNPSRGQPRNCHSKVLCILNGLSDNIELNRTFVHKLEGAEGPF